MQTNNPLGCQGTVIILLYIPELFIDSIIFGLQIVIALLLELSVHCGCADRMMGSVLVNHE